jgi:hypothetical protein
MAFIGTLMVTELGMWLHRDPYCKLQALTTILSGFAIFLIYTRFAQIFRSHTLSDLIVFSATSAKTWDAVLASQEVSGVSFASAGFVIDCVITITLSTLLHRSKTEYAQ